MDEKQAQAVDAQALQDEMTIILEKKAGETQFMRKIEASSARTALYGLAILVAEFAKLLNVSISKMLSMLAVTLLAPAAAEGEEHGEK